LNKKNSVRIFAIVIAALMILSLIYSAFYSMLTVHASNGITYYPIQYDHMVRIAKKFKFSSVDCRAFSQKLSSTGDLGINLYTVIDGNNLQIAVPTEDIMLVCDKNAAMTSAGIYGPADEGEAEYTAFWLISDYSFTSLDDCKNAIASFPSAVKKQGVYPVVKSTGYHIGIGNKLSRAEFNVFTNEYEKVDNFVFSPAPSSDTTIAVLNNDTDEIIFKIDTTDLTLICYPVQPNSSAQTYEIKNETGYTYLGTFGYTCDDGLMTMINTLDVDSYIKGVLPYEISYTWPYEAMKTFAIILRSYTVGGYDVKHPHNDYDFCDETHCQAYRGTRRANEDTNRAVEETKDMICAYNGSAAMTFYHAISGGSTITYNDAWDYSSNAYPYLVSVDTPLEDYAKYPNGVWTKKVSKQELSDYLMGKSKISSKLSTAIVNAEITQYLDNGYAYALTLTDVNGDTATFRQSDEVRNILTAYVKSPNFTISYSASLTVNDASSPIETSTDQIYAISADSSGNTSVSNISPDIKAITDNGYKDIGIDDSTYIFNGKGWGHGVGISQYGIYDMVKLGYKYDEIIKTYFPTVEIVDIHTVRNPMDD